MRFVCGLSTVVFAGFGFVGTPLSDASTVVEVSDIARVWSGHPVGFCLLTDGNDQFVAFYDAERRMTVGQRKLGDATWRLFRLSENLGWDSHNSVTMALDAAGHIHLSGNMHVKPLVYFRTRETRDITTLERIPAMVGTEESRVTYPTFLKGADGALVFTYRDGSSGSGNQIYDVYNMDTQQWRRLLDTPLTDGKGEMNAYFCGPVVGPDGHYHLSWVWRDTPDCATNHDLCYARSTDLVHWESAAGKPLATPITLETADIVDPVPSGGGIINVNNKIGFDSRQRPVIAYHKNDAEGNTQAYNARFEDGRWADYQTSHWDYHWGFGGGGSIVVEISVSPVRFVAGKGLLQDFRHVKYGRGTWVLDEKDFHILDTMDYVDPFPASLKKPESDFPGIQVRWARDAGHSPIPGESYLLRWETLGPNRDRPRDPPWPEPSMLQVVRIRE